MKQLAVSAAALAVLAVSSVCSADEAKRLDLEITMRVLGEYEEAPSVLLAAREELRREGGSRRERRRADVPKEDRVRPVRGHGFDDHRALLKLDDQLEAEVDDEN